MAGWFRKIREKFHKDLNSSCKPTGFASSSSSSGNNESFSATHGVSIPPNCSQQKPKLTCAARWQRDYDLCVFHSEDDLLEVQRLVSYLEGQPEGIRCFLHLRDSIPGGAIPSELCQAVGSSHCWALLITKSFLQDPWCRYQMNQVLAEAPMPDGRIIPILLRLSHSEYPRELRFFYHINITRDQENGYHKIYMAVLQFLEQFCKEDHPTETISASSQMCGSRLVQRQTTAAEITESECRSINLDEPVTMCLSDMTATVTEDENWVSESVQATEKVQNSI
ncbi:toll/interleukin-1 receptor domain-containing adapter protein [Erpetoichthys calabaricus]|uniref:TIR domain containing adaptor protein n=1 Tax=Erpetoichthys calabaricus TaxID=27687 RepID=A0A8C4TCI4_ERPCA|nr:toll/interleukin-1 receptor domain-containing adapter protein [Erpetoichthys calabaricus]XP_028666187.1 toll/interleukin-1 receptor domain-containing adapter protein [Erpetoichthys calabaricus]XP_051788100.1 toll/interleukin-1 receptor domain-containing adapter protein [Erpetoichthys calabaricus]XP_051788101.1 toll/interleukin-1 receptor domain-containing adapter protein [Erpetoichthys calabaricus]